MRRVETGWEPFRKVEKRWKDEKNWVEVGRDKKSWEQLGMFVRKLWRSAKGWEELRWHEKGCEGLRSADHSWKRLRKGEGEFTKRIEKITSFIWAQIALHSYGATCLGVDNFPPPALCGFFGTLEIHKIFLGASWFLLGLQQVEVVFHKFWSSVITLLDWRSSRFIWGCGWRSAIMARCLECSAVAKEKW